MASKRPKRLRKDKGLAPGVRLSRDALPTRLDDPRFDKRWPWGWISESTDASNIGDEEKWGVCFGMWDCCGPGPSSARKLDDIEERASKKPRLTAGQDDDDVIVIDSDSDVPRAPKRLTKGKCTKQHCKKNPNCVNWIGDIWQDYEKSRAYYMKNRGISDKRASQIASEKRIPGKPVGLKNLGATCYANALLQTWFHNQSFRKGIYSVQAPASAEDDGPNGISPIQALQQTFAGLQLSNARSYSPKVLIECLGLQQEVQQDALEFSKLFIALLAGDEKPAGADANPSGDEEGGGLDLKGVIASQFEGTQSYHTHCSGCGNTTTREASFLELDVPLTGNARLEDLIMSVLEPERLQGDNRYACSSCERHQDAERWIEYDKFGNVLHVSLLRFTFDAATLGRRKVKARVSIPLVLDVKGLRKHKDTQRNRESNGEVESAPDEEIYDLRGVLIHKGASAHHGHYECVAWNANDQQWYRYDDETVTSLGASCVLGDRKGSTPSNGKGKDSSQKQPKRKLQESPQKENGVPKINLCSDEEVEILDPSEVQQNLFNKPEVVDEPNYVTSRDAYMLIYARRAGLDSSVASAEPQPSESIQRIIESANRANEEKWRRTEESLDTAASAFKEFRTSMLSVLDNWALESPQDASFVVDSSSLQTWAEHLLNDSKSRRGSSLTACEGQSGSHPVNRTPSGSPMLVDTEEGPYVLDNRGIECLHGGLNPRIDSAMMKRVKLSAFDSSTLPISISPPLLSTEVCPGCFGEMVHERLLALKHNNRVANFELQLSCDAPSPGAWVSKAWLKEWSSKYFEKDYTANTWSYEPPPPPDGEAYIADITCEHGALQPDSSRRKTINGEACAVLSDAFPTWEPIPCGLDNEECQICSEQAESAKFYASKEKKLLQSVLSLSSTFLQVNNPGQRARDERTSLALVPQEFIKSWKAWVQDPRHQERPDGVDNSIFLCRHGDLIVDPEMPKSEADFEYIPVSVWDALTGLYSAGPPIIFHPIDESEKQSPVICRECFTARQLDFVEATVRCLIVSELPDPASEKAPSAPSQVELVGESGSKVYRSTRNRKRQAQEMKLTVTKALTIHELKRSIEEKSGFTLSRQRLYYLGRLLDEDKSTVEENRIPANGVLYLVKPPDETQDESTIAGGPELGFSGTMLLTNHARQIPKEEDSTKVSDEISAETNGTEQDMPSPGKEEEAEEKEENHSKTPEPSSEIQCAQCTFINSGFLTQCEVCEGPL